MPLPAAAGTVTEGTTPGARATVVDVAAGAASSSSDEHDDPSSASVATSATQTRRPRTS
jgi:hypothetical protein